MRIKVINPDYGLSKKEIQEREEKLKKLARPDNEISMECPVNNNIYIDSAADVAIDACEIIQIAMRAEADGYDVVCLYCFSDPAIEACREVLNIPVIGGGQAAILTAVMLGNTFSILTTGSRRISQKKEFVRTTGADYSRLCSVRSIEFGMDESKMSETQLVELLAEAAKQCAKDGADVVILGCLSFIGLADVISERTGIPVVDPASVLIGMAELVVNAHLTHSKKAYPSPPKRERKWSGGNINI